VTVKNTPIIGYVGAGISADGTVDLTKATVPARRLPAAANAYR
jgi:hypothetical protein